MRRMLKHFTALALLSLPFVLAGCGAQSRNPVAPLRTGVASLGAGAARADGSGGGSPALARVLFVHASPDAPAVDIFVGKRPVARTLAFASNTPYRFVRAGSRDVRVNVAGTPTTVIGATVPFQARTAYSVFAVNTVAHLEPLLLTDDLTPPAAGKAHVRFVHLSPDAPAVDVAVAGGGPVVFPNTAFKGYSAFTPLPAGTYDLEVRLAGTNTVVLPLPGVKLEAGRIYTVYAKGLVSGTGAQALGAGIVVNSNGRAEETAGRHDSDDDELARDER